MDEGGIEILEKGEQSACRIVQIRGRLAGKALIHVQTRIGQLLESKCRGLILDLEGVKQINSSGVSYFISLHQSLGDDNRVLMFVKVPQNVMIVMDMLGVTTEFNIYEDKEHALKSVGAAISRITERIQSGKPATNPIVTEDMAFGEIAVKDGCISNEQLAQCLKDQKSLKERGINLKLGQLMLRKRLINPEVFVQICKKQRRKKVWSVSKYELLERVGAGATGTVYLALDSVLKRPVALKVLEQLESSVSRQRFFNEAKALATINHPNVVKIFDFGEDEGQPFLAMEYIAGTSLHTAIKKSVGDYVKLLPLYLEICRAVSFIHSRGIIHRDLKPSNIMVTDSGRVVVMDFSIAKGGDLESLTKTGSPVGTPQYMAPEAITGTSDFQSDVYSLGVILYEILTGEMPFDAATPMELYDKILNEPVKKPIDVFPDIPKSLSDICLKAMEKEKAYRYKTVNDLAMDVYKHSRGDTVSTDGVPITRRFLKEMKGRRWGIIAAMLAVAAVSFGLGYLFFAFVKPNI